MKNMQFIAIKGNCSAPGRGGGGGEDYKFETSVNKT